MDEKHERPQDFERDENDYTFGKIGEHNVVFTVLSHYGLSTAAIASTYMRCKFPNITMQLMVGVAGGLPSSKHDIRLGDVVVSMPDKGHQGVMHHDYGKKVQDEDFQHTGILNNLSNHLVTSAIGLKSAHMLQKDNRLSETINEALSLHPHLLSDYKKPDRSEDRLYKANFKHVDNEKLCVDICASDPLNLVERPIRSDDGPIVHYGLVASGNAVIKDATFRESYGTRFSVLCFEMEAAGLLDVMPSFIIRGICDYSDSHKNKKWQPYASITAGAYAKQLLRRVPPAYKPDASRTSMGDFLCGSCASHEITIEKKTELLKALNYDQIYQREHKIQSVHHGTGKWLLDHAAYLAWLDSDNLSEHHGLFWIKGKPGAGKSTLMKFAFHNTKISKKTDIVLGFFFHARGDLLEKSTIGMYRSLLYQLFQRVDVSREMFELYHLSRWSQEFHQWTVEQLKAVLEHSILAYRLPNALTCFIDALDEADDLQIRDMVSFFHQIGIQAVQNGVKFRVCFSSRPYPEISQRDGLFMILENQPGHTQDIQSYVESKLQVDDTATARELRAEIQKKADGVFLWVYLVIEILTTTDEHGDVLALQAKLREIPEGLHTFFNDMVTRDDRNREKVWLCLQFVLLAKRRMSPEELNTAVLLASDPESAQKLDLGRITHSSAKKFVINYSKGLVEINQRASSLEVGEDDDYDYYLDNSDDESTDEYTDDSAAHSVVSVDDSAAHSVVSVDFLDNDEEDDEEDDEEEEWPFGYNGAPVSQFIVQFIHGSVSDFLLGRSEFEDLRFHEKDMKAKAHERLKQCCCDYLDSKRLKKAMKLFSLSQSRETFLDWAKKKFPFLIYSIESIFFHANEAARYQVDQSTFLKTFDYENWNRLKVKLAQEKLLPQKWNRNEHLLHTLVQQDLEYLILCYADMVHVSCFEPGSQKETPLIIFAGKKRKKRAIRALLKIQQRHTPPELLHFFQKSRGIAWNLPDIHMGKFSFQKSRSILSNLRKFKYEELFATYVSTLPDLDMCSTVKLHRTPLSLAAEIGWERTVEMLLESGRADINSTDKHGRTPLSYAAQRGTAITVSMLLEDEITNVVGAGKIAINSKDNSGRTPLSYAAEWNRRAVVVALLKDTRIDLEEKDKDGCTPLIHAAASGCDSIIELLFNSGKKINCNSRDKYAWTALMYAVNEGYTATVELLLNHKADANLFCQDGWTPLIHAAKHANYDILRLLLNNPSVKHDLADDSGRTALSWALGQAGIIQLFLDSGKVNIESRDHAGRTPFSWAASSGYLRIVVQYLRSGKINVNSRDSSGRTPLSWAASNWRDDIVRVLLDTGVEVDLGDYSGRTPLSWAVSNGSTLIVQMLLEKGKANINSQDLSGRTPISWAATDGTGTILDTLLEANGVDINLEDDFGRSPLSWAVTNRLHGTTFVRKLWETGKLRLDNRDQDGWTPLTWAANYGIKDIISWPGPAITASSIYGNGNTIRLLLEIYADSIHLLSARKNNTRRRR